MKFPKIETVPQKSLRYYEEKNIFDGSGESSEISIFFSANIRGLGNQLVGVAQKERWPVLLVPFIETENGKVEQVNVRYGSGVILETTQPKETSQKLVGRIRKKNIFDRYNNFYYIIIELYPVMVIKVIESRAELK